MTLAPLIIALSLGQATGPRVGRPIETPTADASQRTVTATGSTTARSLADRALDHGVNVLDLGADRTGVADSSPAFQAAVNYAVANNKRMVFIPAGTYTLNSSINLQGIQGLQIVGAGVGWYNITKLVAKCTGRPLFDATGANMLAFRDFIVWGDQTSVPSAAILFSRNGTMSGAGMHDLYQIWTNGYFSKAAIVSLSSEVNRYRSVSLNNSQANAHAFWTDSGNLAVGMVSDFVNPPDVQTGGNTMFRFDSCQFDAFGGGTSVAIKGAFTNAVWDGCYTNSNGDSAFSVSGLTDSVISGHRDESTATYGVHFTGNATNLAIIGSKFGRGIFGDNGVTVERLTLESSEINWASLPDPPGPWALNVDVLKHSSTDTNLNVKVRTTSYANRLTGPGSSANVSLPPTDSRGNDILTEDVLTGYTGTVYTRKIGAQHANDHVEVQRLKAAKVVTTVQSISTAALGTGFVNPDQSLGSTLSITMDYSARWCQLNNASYGPTTSDAGARMTVIFVQDATGGVQPTFAAAWAVGDFKANLAPNAVSVINFVADPTTGKWTAESYTSTTLRGSATLGTSAIPAGTTATQNITVTGAAAGAHVVVGGPSTLEAGLILYAYVSATNTVTLRVANVTTGSITPAGSQTVSVRVFNP